MVTTGRTVSVNHQQNPDEFMHELRALIAYAKSGVKGYSKAAELVGSSQHKNLLQKFEQQRSQDLMELENLAARYGVKANEDTPLGSKLHRFWMNLRESVSGEQNDDDVLAECIRGDNAALEAYQSALGTDLPYDMRRVLQSHFEDIERAVNELAAIRK